MDNKELFRIASEARKKAYSPYSRFNVGAAVLTSGGNVYTGCNIENATYGATCCAERVAIFKAVSEGETDFKRIAIEGDNDGLTFPCGICRQVMAEFAPEIRVILGKNDGALEIFTLNEDLLPNMFQLNTAMG